MNIQRSLFAVAVLALTVGCTWGTTEAFDTAGFTVIPDNEAAEILGGVGWACNELQWPEHFERECGGAQAECSYWLYWYETHKCGTALSGQCDDSVIVIGFSWGDCVWWPEFEFCGYYTAYDGYVYGCVP
jgi:hypothetical protein